MLTRVEIRNYRSFVEAEAVLKPFTLVIGANGAGKTNFLRFFRDVCAGSGGTFRSVDGAHPNFGNRLMPHLNHLDRPTTLQIERGELPPVKMGQEGVLNSMVFQGRNIDLFVIDPDKVSAAEKVGTDEPIGSRGSGIAQMLDALKTGAREDLFNEIESSFREFLPEVEKLSLASAGEGRKSIQVTQRFVKTPIPGTMLSDGTRTLLALLTLIYQPSPPPLLLLEDVDHSIHPRLFEDLIGFFREKALERDVQVIASTHNPYLLDCFQEEPDSVLLVEKENGASTIRCLGDELTQLKKHGGVSQSLSKLYLSGFLSKPS